MRQVGGGGDRKQACAQWPCIRIVYTMFSITVSSAGSSSSSVPTTPAPPQHWQRSGIRRPSHDSNNNCTTTFAEVSTTTTATAAVTPPSSGTGDKTAGSTCCSRAPMLTLSVSVTCTMYDNIVCNQWRQLAFGQVFSVPTSV